MDIIYPDSKMCDVLISSPTLLQMTSRFGIPLGVGDHTIRELCEQHKVDVHTYVQVANFVAHTSRYTAEISAPLDASSLMKYLTSAHEYFLNYLTPSLRRTLIDAIQFEGSDNIATAILRIFDEFHAELRRHIRRENETTFAYVRQLIQGSLPEGYDINRYARTHTALDAKLSELKRMIIKYYSSHTSNSYALCGVLLEITSLEEDLSSHCAVENRLLVPTCRLLEAEATIAHKEKDTEDDKSQATEELTEREREVVKYLALGQSAKEVADELNVSVNTIRTHRKNIARKLDIHSAGGLTIYAVKRGIIHPEKEL